MPPKRPNCKEGCRQPGPRIQPHAVGAVMQVVLPNPNTPPQMEYAHNTPDGTTIMIIIASPQSYDYIESLGEKWESWNKNMNGKIHSLMKESSVDKMMEDIFIHG